MTVTEAPATATGADPAAAAGDGARPSGLAGMLGTVDHVGVGRLWIAAGLLFLLVAGVSGSLVGVERVDTAEISVLDDALVDLFNLHATAGIFLFLLPAFIGVATVVVPLQIGAATVAFPRAMAAAFWGWFLSGGVLVASYFVDGGLDGGPESNGPLLWTVGFGGVVVALILASVSLVTTVWTLRTAGMSLDRVPAFAWSIFVAGTAWLLSLPVLLGGLVLLYLEQQYGSPLDGVSLLRWAYSTPQVFVYALPALGLLLDAVPVAAGVRQRNHGILIAAVAVVGVLGYSPDLLAAGRDPSVFQDALYVAVAFALVLPLLAIAGGVADTVRRGSPKLTSSLLFGVVALVALLLASVANAVRVVDALDLVGTTVDTGVAHLALAAGAVGVVGALHHWSTKIFGSVLGEGVGRLAALVLLAGGAVLALPDVVSGFLEADGSDQGQLTGLSPGPVADGVEALNLVSLLGGGLVLLGVLLVLVNLVGAAARRSDERAPDDPWGGHTLEWRTTSPPDPAGPGPLAPVTSAAPLLDLQEADG